MFFFFKQKTAYEMRISDWSSDVCSSDLRRTRNPASASCHAASEPARPPPMMWMSCVMSLSVDLCSMARALRWYGVGLKRHCERSEAIQSGLRLSGLLRFARNDDDRLPALGRLKASNKGEEEERKHGEG